MYDSFTTRVTLRFTYNHMNDLYNTHITLFFCFFFFFCVEIMIRPQNKGQYFFGKFNAGGPEVQARICIKCKRKGTMREEFVLLLDHCPSHICESNGPKHWPENMDDLTWQHPLSSSSPTSPTAPLFLPPHPPITYSIIDQLVTTQLPYQYPPQKRLSLNPKFKYI